ncbi:Alpha/Beta hydrolase [Lipomyces kononenkoae]
MTDYEFIPLATKPSAKLCYSFHPPIGTTKPVLIVFVNGLGMPQTSWESVIARLRERPPSAGLPAMLTYDRYGLGQTTDRDPADADVADPMRGHDCLAVVRDLRQLLIQITFEKQGISDIDHVQLVFVCNSIGGALTRLYAQEYPGTVSGLLRLDSVLANSDFVSIYPDPDAPDFDASTLPAGVTIDAIREARAYMQRVFHPVNGSKEGLSRRNLCQLLPANDGPQLQGPGGRGPWVTVVGHEFVTFEGEFEGMGGAPPLLTRLYMNPYWHCFNEGLTDKDNGTGAEQGSTAGPGVRPFRPKRQSLPTLHQIRVPAHRHYG